MNNVSSKSCLKKFLFTSAAALLLVVGISADALAQRGVGRGPSIGGGSLPTATVGRPVIVVPERRRGGSIDEFPTRTRTVRRFPDIERRDDDLRRERERRERDGVDVDTRRDVPERRDDEANRFQKLGRWLGVSPERLQHYFLEAKASNPNLRLSQFFSALVIANRLNGSNQNVTAQAILRGLDAGMNMERTLVALGLTAEEASAAAKWAARVANHLKP